MSKKQNKFSSFHKRAASFSTRGKQNGHVTVLPPEAEEYQLVAESLHQRQADLRQAKQIMMETAKSLGINEKHLLNQKIHSIDSSLCDIKATINRKRELGEAVLFYRLARYMMTYEAFKKISLEVSNILRGEPS